MHTHIYITSYQRDNDEEIAAMAVLWRRLP